MGTTTFSTSVESMQPMLPSHTERTIPVADGRLLLGTWQGIYLFEHRKHSQERKVVLHLSG